MYVYQLVAKFVCPLTGFEGRPDAERYSTTLFKTPEAAEKRIEEFKRLIRARFKVREDYPIEVTLKRYEVIEE